MKKKLLALIMALVMLLPLALAACSDDGKDDNGGDPNIDTRFPSDPNFDALTGFTSTDKSQWGEAKAHDPSVIEDNGTYYVFSTDNDGGYGYQVRKSTDLIHWDWVGFAIENCGTSEADAAKRYQTDKNGGLQEVYNVISQDPNWGTAGGGQNRAAATWTLWAPDVVKGSDGKYWLYGCWTADFGQGHSVIFLCKANSVTGPYTFDSILLYSYDGWPTNNNNPNAIDPQIYTVGERMFMAYGSFTGGTWTIELDPATGRRKDGLSGNDLLSGSSKTEAERYGTRLIPGTATEGPTVNYHEDVAIYPTDLESIKNYDASKLTYEDRYYLMGSKDSLSEDYNMRSFWGTADENGIIEFKSYETSAQNGNRVSGSFTWKTGSRDRSVSYDFFAPGHNDMLTTSAGDNVIVYHNRINFGGSQGHYLFVSSYAFNSRGDLVINPNRYAGEKLCKFTDADFDGNEFYYAVIDADKYAALENSGYAADGLVLAADNTVTLDGQNAGEWYLYGDYYIYIELNDTVYYGVAMPAWIQKANDGKGAGGITISCLSEDGQDTLFMNAKI